ncbi:hypothetical protein KAR91_04865 [Candidatus Pacearchaeota archaeon]|nr:hypothetical protein [Candidatus Pacearchaeota archaeon]
MKQKEYNELLDQKHALYALISAIQNHTAGIVVIEDDLDYLAPAYKLMDQEVMDNFPPEDD